MPGAAAAPVSHSKMVPLTKVGLAAAMVALAVPPAHPGPVHTACLAHASAAGRCSPHSPGAAVTQLLTELLPREAIAAASDLLSGDSSAWGRRARAMERDGDATGSLLMMLMYVKAQPHSASRWSDLSRWLVSHRPGGPQHKQSDTVVGSVAAAVLGMRVSAELESRIQRKPQEAVSAAVDLAEAAIEEGGGNTPEPLLAAELLELAMEIERASGESWAINWGPRSDWTSKATQQGGPFHAVALALWEHGHPARAESIWREQTLRLRGISRKDCGRRDCPYYDVETNVAVAHKLRHDAAQFRYIASKAGLGLVANRFTKEATKLERLLEKESPQQTRTADQSVSLIAATYTELQLEAYEVLESYNRAVHLPPYPRRAVPPSSRYATLNPQLDFSALDAQYVSGSPSFVVVDELFEPQTLAQLYEMCLDSTFWWESKTQIFEAHTDSASGQSWPRHEAGYVGAYDFAAFNQPLLMQAAEEIRAAFPQAIGDRRLAQMWAYKYESGKQGVQAHADHAAVNVNVWLTPTAANLDPKTGGLVVFQDLWGDELLNGQGGTEAQYALDELVAQHALKNWTVPYARNRATIFDSGLVHKTDSFRFKADYQSRRINLTFLFGEAVQRSK